MLLFIGIDIRYYDKAFLEVALICLERLRATLFFLHYIYYHILSTTALKGAKQSLSTVVHLVYTIVITALNNIRIELLSGIAYTRLQATYYARSLKYKILI